MPADVADASSPDAIEALIQRCLRGRSGAPGSTSSAALAQGLQRRVQVRRQARRGRGSHAGHLPEDLQVARHVRSARELPDVADQRQPQPLHRSLPQRPQGARDDRPRRRRRASWRRPRRTPSPYRGARAARSRGAAARRRWRRCPPTLRTAVLHARHPGAVVSGDRRPAAACRKARSSRASTAGAPSSRGRSASCAASDYSPSGRRRRPAAHGSVLMNVTTEQSGGVVDRPRRRDAADVSAARRLLGGGQRPRRAAASATSSST